MNYFVDRSVFFTLISCSIALTLKTSCAQETPFHLRSKHDIFLNKMSLEKLPSKENAQAEELMQKLTSALFSKDAQAKKITFNTPANSPRKKQSNDVN